MRIQKKQSKKPLIITACVILVVVALASAAFVLTRDDSSTPKTNDTATDKTNKKSKESDAESSKASTSTETSTVTSGATEAEKDTQPSYEGPDANLSESLTGSINYSAVVDSTLIIRTTIDQGLASGACELALTSGSKTLTKTSEITPNPSSSSCAGFDIPTSELSGGTWNITITLSGDSKTGILAGTVKI